MEDNGKTQELCLRLCVTGLPRLCVLLGCLALGGPSVDDSDLVLERSVDNAMTLKRVEALELGGDDNGGEGLTAAACDNPQR